jgi:very-short-patch-repair endonuclease
VAGTAQTEAVGLTRSQRRTLLKSGALKALRGGVVTSGERWDAADFTGRHRLHLAGVLLLRGWRPDAAPHKFVGGLRTAAFLHGLPFQPEATAVEAWKQERGGKNLSPEAYAVLAEVKQIRRGEGPRHIDLVSPNRRRTYENWVRTRPAALPADHVVLNEGVPVTSMARTAVDLMRDGTPADAWIAADGALHLGVRRAELDEVAAFCAGWANIHQALDAIAAGNRLAESPAESLARFVCAQHIEVPKPQLQVELYDALGLIGRVDLFFRCYRVVLEVDGFIKYTDPWCGDAREALRLQHEREARLRRAGWIVIRTTWEELTTDPDGFIRRLLAAFAQAA